MFVWLVVLLPLSVSAAPYAAMVMDARNGKVLHAHNADTRLHPASLTKMMTLYIAFEAVQNGELTMDTLITVSRKAAAEEPSKLGLRAGQKIKLRYLVRAAAVKSANDAATAIAEGIEGSEAAFARRMNRTAKAMGMTRTTFKNAHGLTESGHLSTARDMTILGRHVIYDYPQYYNLFSRKTADAGVRKVSHTNSRLLSSYRGADGIKTGYTRAAGFNLVASAERGSERVIATVFGGRSTASRNARVAELLDLGFKESPKWAKKRDPKRPPYLGKGAGAGGIVVANTSDPAPGTRAKSIRVASAAVTRSLRPMARPGSTVDPAAVAPLVARVEEDIERELMEVAQVSDTAPVAEPPDVTEIAVAAPAESRKPVQRPVAMAAAATLNFKDTPTPAREAEVVTRLSTSGGRHWGINIGRFPSEYTAQKILLKTALSETATLDGASRKVVRGKTGFDATFMGLTRDGAELACRRLQARQMTCFMVGPG
ncbi:D-alanyl-D-alanine carboxypeptidase family protein [Mameliella sediminis]|uniref:D-alanyl-D-alanine carboxypeptidase family protein n=1 Tax=Mameliella sediminis TaxID=2836866 RepID=UPI001C488CE1|nr:D-alanyl-D-alanine carboxypeptidase family protein [Mameliella sediminis]MBY6113584.1 serine hydrolase [Antarctobacter heliothermus]MBY6143068.1 serine hydrolase [Mameliella alba]MBV7394882.1 serine hydrolase [Mameliella sediminis]MBY6159923.1 serine hydrolase [Mameliella alba]MBY6168394.1 serine hydrolase [Mameliella alba]